MRPDDELIAGQGMADENGIGFFGVEGAVGLIGEREGAEQALRIQAQLFVGSEFDAKTVGRVGRRRMRRERLAIRHPAAQYSK